MAFLANARDLITDQEHTALFDQMKNLEASDESVPIKIPDFWIVGIR